MKRISWLFVAMFAILISGCEPTYSDGGKAKVGDKVQAKGGNIGVIGFIDTAKSSNQIIVIFDDESYGIKLEQFTAADLTLIKEAQVAQVAQVRDQDQERVKRLEAQLEAIQLALSEAKKTPPSSEKKPIVAPVIVQDIFSPSGPGTSEK